MKASEHYDQLRELLRGERLPAVVVDLDAFDRNVRNIARVAESGSKTLRLATKSIRVPTLIQRALKTGKPFQGLMCYSAEEAGFLADKGFDDLLVAYPTLNTKDLKILRNIHEKGKRVYLVVDGLENLKVLNDAMSGVGLPFSAVIEVDASLRFLKNKVHLGVRRSPLHDLKTVEEFLNQASRFKSVRMAGFMVYEAQVAGLGDANPFKKALNPIASWIRHRSVKEVASLREGLADLFRRSGFQLEIFNGGGSGSLNFSVREPWLTEVTAGSALLCPHLFDYYSNISFEPACFFALQAVRKPSPDFVTCSGGGYLASGEPGWDKVPKPYLPRGCNLVSTEGCGEVQTPVQLPEGVDVALGDPIFFRHAKAGELAERFTEYLLVSSGKIVERAQTYRGLSQCFF